MSDAQVQAEKNRRRFIIASVLGVLALVAAVGLAWLIANQVGQNTKDLKQDAGIERIENRQQACLNPSSDRCRKGLEQAVLALDDRIACDIVDRAEPFIVTPDGVIISVHCPRYPGEPAKSDPPGSRAKPGAGSGDASPSGPAAQTTPPASTATPDGNDQPAGNTGGGADDDDPPPGTTPPPSDGGDSGINICIKNPLLPACVKADLPLPMGLLFLAGGGLWEP